MPIGTSSRNNIKVDLKDDGGCEITIPGTPLRFSSNARKLQQFRNSLQKAVEDLPCFPYPFNVPIKLSFGFAYPDSVIPPGMIDMMDIAREITIGILYESNDAYVGKDIRREMPEDNIGYTRIKIEIR